LRELSISIFHSFPALIVFLHVLSAIIWVGGMIAIRFAVHYSMAKIDDPSIKLGRILHYLQNFFKMVIPSIFILLITAIIMIFAFNFKETNFHYVVVFKEVVWMTMAAIFAVIYSKRSKAQKAFYNKDFKKAKEYLMPIATWMIPVNIFLGVVALYIGVTLRGL
jgi:uncharacterized membrane protein